MDAIRQQFIIDAGNSIATLGSLQKGLDAVNGSLTRLGGSVGSTNGFDKVAKDTAAANKSTRELTVSWETLKRVFATQVIVSVLGKIKRGLADSTTEAIKFRKQVTLIQTLVDPSDSFSGFDDISDRVRAISDTNNIPLLEATEAAYNAISNQVGDLGESLNFTAEAAEFAKSTNSSLADSVDLLSAAVRAYGLDIDQTGELSGLFFNIIDKGRINASELANTFGRVGAPAANLGVSLEELGGFLSVVSDKGFRTSEVLTQFRGTLNTLQKPSASLRDALREIGFESPEAAIGTIGLINTLQRLKDTTEGSSQEFSKLFPNIRGSTGILSLLNADGREVADVMDSMAKATGEFAESKALIVVSDDGEVLTNTLNRLKNEATDVGDTIVRFAASFVNARGGPEEFISLLKDVATFGAAVVAPLLAGAASVKAFTAVNLLLAGGPITAGIVVLAAALGTVALAARKLNETDISNALDSVRDLTEAGEEAQRKLSRSLAGENFDGTAATSGVRQVVKVAQDVTTALGGVFAEFNKGYLKSIDGVRDGNKILVDSTTSSINGIISSQEALIKGLRDNADNSVNVIKASLDRVASLRGAVEQTDFDSSISQLDEASQVFALTSRAEDKAREAANLLSEAGNDQTRIDAALDVFAQAEAESKRAESVAQASDNRTLEAKAATAVKDIIRQQISAEETLQRISKQRAAQANAEADRRQKILTTLKEQAKIVVDNTGLFDASGNEFGADEQRERTVNRQNALKAIQSTALSSNELSIADILGVSQLGNQVNQELSRNVSLGFNIDNETARLKSQLEESFADIRVKFKPIIDGLEQETGQELNNISDVQGALGEFSKQFQQGTKLTEVLREAELAAKNTGAELDAAFSEVSGLDTLRSKLQDFLSIASGGSEGQGENGVTRALSTVKEAFVELSELSNADTLDVEAVEAIVERVRAAEASIGSIGTTVSGLAGPFALILDGEDGIAAKLVELAEAQEKVAETAVKLQESQGSGSLATGAELFEKMAQAAERVGALDLDLSKGQNQLTGAAAASDILYNNMLRTSQLNFNNVANIANGGPPTATVQRFGTAGLQFFQTGGLARGVDTIPAMLAPGESVINSRSTNRFFSQLQAINAGQQPVFRAQNGGTTTNVGDVHVSVQGGDSGAATARDIAHNLRRELRRGTSRF